MRPKEKNMKRVRNDFPCISLLAPPFCHKDKYFLINSSTTLTTLAANEIKRLI